MIEFSTKSQIWNSFCAKSLKTYTKETKTLKFYSKSLILPSAFIFL